jgi:hypothetical protein
VQRADSYIDKNTVVGRKILAVSENRHWSTGTRLAPIYYIRLSLLQQKHDLCTLIHFATLPEKVSDRGILVMLEEEEADKRDIVSSKLREGKVLRLF